VYIALSALLVFVAAIGLGFALQLSRKRARAEATRIEGEPVVLETRGVTARVFVDQTMLAGPQAGKVNRAPADLILTPERLLVATHQGRLLELKKGSGGSVRCTGPGRLVLEGRKPRAKAEMKIRVEVLTDKAEQFASRAHELLQTSRSAVA
jgi:hypothetical protein